MAYLLVVTRTGSARSKLTVARPAPHTTAVVLRIAALCLAHGVQALCPVDRDFSRFPALQVVNPLTREAE